MDLNIKDFKVKDTTKIVNFVSNKLYLETTTFENDGDFTEINYTSIDNEIELVFYKTILKNYNKYDYFDNLAKELFKTIKSNNELDNIKNYYIYTNTLYDYKKCTEDNLIIFLDDMLYELLGFQSNSSEHRILNDYNFCYFNISENKKITVFV